ncbi:hypothetical protein CIL05_19905 [Virgibacillus profundi]|uniref:Transglutaminase-like domain-containing protein n=1 Tax=Virgibacillus profundi TaxID=2024555 RepID=A0A2A2I9J6_9BACI|nr:transglutaminase domain-containing protein [Virgibacillus profundi]PAV27815.1 hypothetical protein CIL05_19905 [Virgibacillus profundi]PXY51942.1 hypothetical protein CIT14_20270 [Virgibacillus profundi]
MSLTKNNIPFLYTSILYFSGFFLFLEWLYPVKEITDTSNLSIFIIYTLFCFFISMFQMKWWIGFLLKGFGLLFIIDGLFFEYGFMSKLWFDYLFMEIAFNLEALFSQAWYQLTPIFRSVLFLLLIWLMSYLLHYWFVVMKRIFLFVLLTFIYLAILDTFTIYDAGMPMVRTFIISFIALGIANFMKELDKESIRFTWIKKTPIWLIPLVVIVLFSTVIGFAAPKLEPQWPDPVPFLKSTAENAGSGSGSGVQKVGYGEDDSQLGGSFVQDYTPVFQAAVAEEHYWRIESKDVYTGKGWEVSNDPDYQQQTNGSISLATFHPEAVETEEFEAMIEFQGNTDIDKLIYPYGIQQVYAAEADYYLDGFSEAIETRVNGEAVSLDSYTISYNNPSFDLTKLREQTQSEQPEFQDYYTKLPEGLPNRVGELAEEITSAYDTRYEKAKAIEGYFGRNGFSYQTTDVPVPAEDEDYVDQFLFDSKVGYCDNYSTSMVVMLRTLDIPARWVKGFTSGEMIADDVAETGDSFDVYEVTNANAHSWVEVYFPESGWVPFEPTQGFDNLTDFHTDVEDNTSEEAQDDVLEPTPEMNEPEPPEVPEEEAVTVAAGSNPDSFELKAWHIAIAVGVLAIIALIIYKTRFRWQTFIVEMKFTKKQDAKTYQDAYHHLMKILNYKGITKEPDQTLREFAERIDERFTTNEMGQLTAHFERMLYKDEINHTKAKELTQLWKNLIKRIMG